MFWRYLEADHPANAGKDVSKHRGALRELYKRMDDLVGRVMERSEKIRVLIVMSDHGMKSFQRGINSILAVPNGYLSIKQSHAGPNGFRTWTGQRRSICGWMGGIYLNLKGRGSPRHCAPGGRSKT